MQGHRLSQCCLEAHESYYA